MTDSHSYQYSRITCLAMTIALAGIFVSGCGGELQDHLQALKNCEVISGPHANRCRKRELPEAVTFSSDRRYFQSRDVVYLAIDDELLDYGHYFSVINSSTKTLLIDDEPVPQQATEYEGFNLFENARVKVRIHPGMNPDYYLWNGVENDLRVVSQRGRNGDFRYNVSILHFQDYEWVGPQAIAASMSVPSEYGDYKAELWISEQAQPTVYSQDTAVTMGGFSALNPMY